MSSKIFAAIFQTILIILIFRNPNKTVSSDKVVESVQHLQTPWLLVVPLSLLAFYIHVLSTSGKETLLEWSYLDLFSFFLLVISSATRLWCYATLGRLFTFDLAIRPKHKLVTTGPYAWVRHPSYTAMFLAWIGYALFFMNPRMIRAYLGVFSLNTYTDVLEPTILSLNVLGTLTFIAIFVNRISKEEDMLAKEFKDQWTHFASTRKRLIPLVW